MINNFEKMPKPSPELFAEAELYYKKRIKEDSIAETSAELTADRALGDIKTIGMGLDRFRKMIPGGDVSFLDDQRKKDVRSLSIQFLNEYKKLRESEYADISKLQPMFIFAKDAFNATQEFDAEVGGSGGLEEFLIRRTGKQVA